MSASEVGYEGGCGTSPAGRLSVPSPDGRLSVASPAGESSGSSRARDSGRTEISFLSSTASYDKPSDLELNDLDRITRTDFPSSDEEVVSSNVPGHKEGNIRKIDWNGDDDPRNPYNFTNRRKWIITGTALLASFLVPMHGTSVTVAGLAINEEFGISDENFPNSYWPVASWGFGCAVWIIVGLPLMEDLGIRRWFLINYALFFVFIIPQALAKNFQTLVVTRFFAGGFGELPTSAVASIIPDLWATGKERSLPVSLLNLAVMGGLTIAPPIFAPVMSNIGNWRWIFYIQLILYAALFPILWFGLEETRGAVLLKMQAQKHRKEHPAEPVYSEAETNAQTTLAILKASTSRPFIFLATEPVVLSISLWSAFSFGNVFLFTQSTEQVYRELYDWKFYETAYSLIAVFIGEVLGWAATVFGLTFYLSSAKRNTEFPNKPIPESRLYVSIFGSFVGITGGMFVYGWTSYKDIHWIAPSIGLAMVGFGIQTVVSAACDYLEDSYAASDYAATAVSALAFLENIFGSFLPFASYSMYTNLGFHWASSLLGILALIISIGPLIFTFYGKWFRDRSQIMASGGKSVPALTISGQQRDEENTTGL